MLTLIRGARVFAPKPLGCRDVVLAGGKICGIGEQIELKTDLAVTVIDAAGKLMLPGLIDNHVHIAGGGGESGFSSRTPEISLSDITLGGVTTVIGTLGTDGTTRTMANLLAKAHSLEEEGITTFVHTGSYQIPVRTVTGSVTDDIILLDKVIGVGEVAVSDHRSSCPTWQELARLASEARVGGMLSGKAGTVNIHVGDSVRMLDLLERVLAETDIPIRHFVPTHMNRNADLYEKAKEYLRRGGNVDFTTSTVPAFIREGEVAAASALRLLLEDGIPTDRVTLSSDGQGSLPQFGPDGELTGLDVGRVSSLFHTLREAVLTLGIPLEDALPTVTSNVAQIFGLRHKGRVETGYDADIILVSQDRFCVDTVFANGRMMVRGAQAVCKGVFE